MLRKRELPGVGFYAEERRRYPQGAVGAQVLGYAGVDNQGLAGLELQLDRRAAGRPGRETVIRDPFGRVVDVLSETAERQGRDVFLTLDHRIQANAEDVLRRDGAPVGREVGDRGRARPAHGRDLAMARAPAFDANRFAEASPDAQRNRAVTDTYEPGSTFKLVTGRRRALRGARHAAHGVHARRLDPRRRPRDPRRTSRGRRSG